MEEGKTKDARCGHELGVEVLRFKHLSWTPGAEFLQGRPFRAQEQFLHRPLPLHRQHLGGIPLKLTLPSRTGTLSRKATPKTIQSGM